MSAPCPYCRQARIAVPLLATDELVLSFSERAVLNRLNARPGAAVPMSDLIEALYGHRADGGVVTARETVCTYISNLQKKLPADFVIENIWGFGYRLAVVA